MASRIGRLSGALLLASGALVAGTGPPAGALPALELGSGERLLVVAPHPDGESLCCAALVRAGLGITVMPDSYSDPGVARVRLEGFTPRRVIGLCYAGEAARPSAFVQAAREVFGEMG